MLGLVGAVKTATDDVRPDCYKHFAEWNNDGGEGRNKAVDCTHESGQWREKNPRLITLLVCAFVVLGVVGWATLGGNEGHRSARSTSRACRAPAKRAAKWCHEHHPDDTPACTKAVSADEDDRNVGKRSIASRSKCRTCR
ncbi:hypothetical protein [Streptomyces sp. NPDC005890]|uniref:hypothetical protein n=1 Tax=Streptomyces sp. NPDC005890 TaxID=3154568 RepID=UPI0033F1A9B2